MLLPLLHSEEISDHVYAQNLCDTYLKSHPQFNNIKKAWNVAPALTGDHLMGVGPKTEAGFNENMQRIAAAHPTSALADRYGSGETNAKIKARNIVKKHISTK